MEELCDSLQEIKEQHIKGCRLKGHSALAYILYLLSA